MEPLVYDTTIRIGTPETNPCMACESMTRNRLLCDECSLDNEREARLDHYNEDREWD